MTGLVRGTVALVVAGWLAQQLASTDRDVERGIAAYEEGNYDDALAAFDAAIERRGERPELAFDRGLVLLARQELEGAREAFDRATEADEAAVRGSAYYELGNLAFDREEWDAAISHYIECLKAVPEHGNAKWNLELALERKRAEEEEREKEEQEQEDSQSEDSSEEQEDGQESPDDSADEKQDEQDSSQESQDEPKDDTEQPQDEPSEDQGEDQGDEGEDEPQPASDEEDSAEDEPQPEGESAGEDEPSSEEAKPTPIQQMNIDKALEELDQQDPLMLDRPVGGFAQPEKDW